MTTLYVQQQGASIRRVGQTLVVEKDSARLDVVRLRDLESVTLFGGVELTGPAMAALMDAGIETTFLTYGGRYRGRLAPAEGKNVFLRRAQYRRLDDSDFRLETARTIVAAKIRNARYLLQRHAYNHPSDGLTAAINEIEAGFAKPPMAATVESLLGFEGDAARVYFKAFGGMVRSEFAFTTRSRRPPRDPVNALLGFGYTILGTEIAGALAAESLDPQVGYLHELDYGRPSLALDILEEFRQPLVDRLILSLVNRSVLTPAHFEDRGNAGVLLNDLGRPRFLEYYHRTMETPFKVRRTDAETTYRALLRRQAKRIRRAIEGGARYVPFNPRGGEGETE